MALLGTLVVTAGEQVIGGVVRVIGNWLSRGANRTAKLKLGEDEIELTNVSDEDQRRLLEAFLTRHAADSG
jgi:hypothetical protein